MVCVSRSGDACTNILIPNIYLRICSVLGGEGWKAKSQKAYCMFSGYNLYSIMNQKRDKKKRKQLKIHEIVAKTAKLRRYGSLG